MTAVDQTYDLRVENAHIEDRRIVRTLPRLYERLFGEPLLIEEGKLDEILRGLGERFGLDVEPLEEERLESLRARGQARTSRPYTVTPQGVAVIPVMGSLVQRGTGLNALSGLRSYEDIGMEVEQAAADPQVQGILLHVDSPGGEARGAFSAADVIAAAGRRKPLRAVTDDIAYSAGYLLAAPAEKITLPRTGGVGSIGVVAVHVDASKAYEQRGLRHTVLRAGARKADGHPYGPLEGDALRSVQGRLEQLYDTFVQHVAQHRGLSPKAVRSTEGDLFLGQRAVDTGLADNLGDFRSALADFHDSLTSTRVVVQGGAGAGSGAGAGGATAQGVEAMAEQGEGTEGQGTQEGGSQQQAAAAASQASSSSSASSNVVDIDAARGEGRDYALEVIQLCQLAGHGHLAEGFIQKGTSAAQVRKELMRLRAESTDAQQISGRHGGGVGGADGGAGRTLRQPDYNKVYAPLNEPYYRALGVK